MRDERCETFRVSTAQTRIFRYQYLLVVPLIMIILISVFLYLFRELIPGDSLFVDLTFWGVIVAIYYSLYVPLARGLAKEQVQITSNSIKFRKGGAEKTLAINDIESIHIERGKDSSLRYILLSKKRDGRESLYGYENMERLVNSIVERIKIAASELVVERKIAWHEKIPRELVLIITLAYCGLFVVATLLAVAPDSAVTLAYLGLGIWLILHGIIRISGRSLSRPRLAKQFREIPSRTKVVSVLNICSGILLLLLSQF